MASISASSCPPCSPQLLSNSPIPNKKESSQRPRIERQNMRSEASNVVKEYSKLSDVKNAEQLGTDEGTQTYETDFEVQSPQNTIKYANEVHDAVLNIEKLSSCSKIGTTISAVDGNLPTSSATLRQPVPLQAIQSMCNPTLSKHIVDSSVDPSLTSHLGAKVKPSQFPCICQDCKKVLDSIDDLKWHTDTKYGREDCRILQSMIL